jgi:hypothetical protein
VFPRGSGARRAAGPVLASESVKHVSLASGSLGALAVTLSGCYWLAQYEDLSSAFGDAGSAVDAQSVLDAGQLVDGGLAPPFCPPGDAGPLVYCMDFDGVDAAVLGLQLNGASAQIVNGASVSPPSSLFVGLQGDGSYGKYIASFGSLQPTTATLEFQVQTANLNEGVTTFAIVLSDVSTETVRMLNVVMLPRDQFQVQEYFSFGDGGAELYAHGPFQADAGAVSNGWHHVVLTLTLNGAPAPSFSGLTVDDQVLEDGQPLMLAWAEGTVSLLIGVTFAAAGGPQFFFDNVRADFKM